MATKRLLCPMSQMLSVKPTQVVGGTDEISLKAAPCMGPKCQLWLYDATGPVDDGNCALAITAFSSANVAQRTEDAFTVLREQQVEADKVKADVELARTKFSELLTAAEKLTVQLVQLAKK